MSPSLSVLIYTFLQIMFLGLISGPQGTMPGGCTLSGISHSLVVHLAFHTTSPSTAHYSEGRGIAPMSGGLAIFPVSVWSAQVRVGSGQREIRGPSVSRVFRGRVLVYFEVYY